jgi:hypothetical protein
MPNALLRDMPMASLEIAGKAYRSANVRTMPINNVCGPASPPWIQIRRPTVRFSWDSLLDWLIKAMPVSASARCENAA